MLPGGRSIALDKRRNRCVQAEPSGRRRVRGDYRWRTLRERYARPRSGGVLSAGAAASVRSPRTIYGAARAPDDQYADYAKRISFLIDPDGVVQRSYEVTDTAAHADDVLNDLAELRG